MMGMLLWSMLSLSPHSLVCMPLGQCCLEFLRVMGMLLWSMLSLSTHGGVHGPWSMLS